MTIAPSEPLPVISAWSQRDGARESDALWARTSGCCCVCCEYNGLATKLTSNVTTNKCKQRRLDIELVMRIPLDVLADISHLR